MSFRTRVLIASLVAAAAPLTLLTFGVRREVAQRLSAQYAARVDAATAAIREDVARSGAAIDARLEALASGIEEDARVRAAVVRREEPSALIDWAGRSMPLAGLDYLMLIDGSSRILSSGHFRNEYDRRVPVADSVLARAEGPVLVRARTAEGSFLALVRARALELGGRRFLLAGGRSVDRGFLDRLAGGGEAGGLDVALVAPGAAAEGAPDEGPPVTTAELPLPYLDDTAPAPAPDTARIVVTHSLAPLLALQRGMDRWFVAALLAASLLAVVIAHTLSTRVSRPLIELAGKTRRLDLDRLDVDFRSTRRDEIGTLASLMAAMVERLRASVAQLRQAERRATVGDMARQVNHDIRNGLLPIRNVVRHLAEVAREAPASLPGVFAEREGTLTGGIGYLESLASTYARLSPRGEVERTDLNAIVRAVAGDTATPPGATLTHELERSLPLVSGDPIALRRIVENLVVNAIESLNGGGAVAVSTLRIEDARGPTVTLIVSDTGQGMDATEMRRIFEDYYTTKPRGTGLGLSIVRRLVADLGGRVEVESEPGRGSRFRVELPALDRGGDAEQGAS